VPLVLASTETQNPGVVSGDIEQAHASGGINLEWENIECFVSESEVAKGIRKFAEDFLGWEGPAGPPTKRIMSGSTGFARTGEVLALMGPSGSGKTTLLNILAQRPTLGHRGYWTGALSLNGNKPWPDWEREMAYVMQKDIFYDELKVWENLRTTALLRLPYAWSKERKIGQLQKLLEDFGLENVKETKIGTATERGLSGGEVKRTSIVNECLGMPRIFLLDEPLTGLDSSRAVDVMQSLRRMARECGTTVMLTIHQPSSSLYECFDRLMLLGPGGRTAFFGGVHEAIAYFARIGKPVPAFWTPTDHYIEVLATESSCREICDMWAIEQHPVVLDARLRPPSASPLPPVWYQVKVLLPRSATRIQRTYLKRMNCKLHFFSALVFGIVYFGVGRKSMPLALDDYMGTLFFIVGYWSWTPLFEGLNNFPRDKQMLIKEKTSKVYTLWAYFISQVLGEAPVLLVEPAIFFIVMWPLAGLDWLLFPQTYLLMALNVQVCSSLSMCISAICLDTETGMAAAIVVILLELCSGGYFADLRRLPPWISWMRYLSFFYYAFGSTTRTLVGTPFGEEALQQAIAKYSFSDLGYSWEICILLVQMLVFRTVSYLFLRISKRLRFT